jgi:cell division protein FtsI (penicillin-binding protein 3)
MIEFRRTGKFIGVAVILFAMMAGLVVRLVFLHVSIRDQSRSRAAKTRTYRETLTVPRGRILDGSMSANIMAANVSVKDIWVDPSLLAASNRFDEVALKLARVLGLPSGELRTNLKKPGRRFAYVSRFVPDERAAAVATLKLPGVFQSPITTRSYPQGQLLCHVLGFVNHDGIGSGGIEQCMENYLKGVPGLLESRLDGRRREMYDRRVREVAPREGSDVVLTIDQNLQYILEKGVDAAMEKHQAKAVMAIMQRVKTGEILAMVSRPGFDPNQFRETVDAQKLNRTIGYVYEPGSTFKVAVIAAALDQGIVTPETVFDCENGRWLYQNKILRDYHSYGLLNVADVLKKSSNIGAAKIAIMMGDARLDKSLRAFMIGCRLGIDLPGEEGGILRQVENWSPISSSRIAIGQGVAVTALQMLGVMCGIANDGRVMRPYVVKEVVSSSGTVLMRQTPHVLSQPIRPETAALMRTLLARVTEEGGTGVKACVDGYSVAGKTGTAQKPVAGHYSESAYMASFVGFLPAENPEIGMIIVVDEPQPLHTGGLVSAPVFGEVAEQAVRYLGILPGGAPRQDGLYYAGGMPLP